MNFTQATVRNMGTHGLMSREYIKRKNHKIRVLIQPWGRLGCSSVEAPVMGMERRIRIIRL